MKTKLLIMLLCAVFLDVKAQCSDYVHIPDANFKEALLNNALVNTNNDDEISCEEATSYSFQLVFIDKGISDLTGIEAFVNIYALTCADNDLTSIDVSNNTALLLLDCSENQLTAIDTSSNTQLETLRCDSNLLTNLDISSNTELEILDCGTNELSNLNISSNTELETLYCNSNQLTNIDISSNTELETLYCNSNQLTNLDISNNTKIESLYCSFNELTSLNLANGNNTLIGSDFSARFNSNLNCIQVDDVSYSENFWNTKIDAQVNFSLNCGATASVDDFSLEEFNSYPNPVKNVLHISLKEDVEEVSIYTLQGKKLIQTNSNEINVSAFSPGVYIIKVDTTLGKVGVKRFIKQ